MLVFDQQCVVRIRLLFLRQRRSSNTRIYAAVITTDLVTRANASIDANTCKSHSYGFFAGCVVSLHTDGLLCTFFQ